MLACLDPALYDLFLLIANINFRPLVKSAYRKINFLISQPKHLLKLMGKEIFMILRSKKLLM